jgi:hypothetical protein
LYCQESKILFELTQILEPTPMIFIIEILGEPDRRGKARVIERRTHTGPTISEALRTARANLRTPPPSAYSFSMKADGKEVGRWQWSGGDNKADVLADIESGKSTSHTDDDL